MFLIIPASCKKEIRANDDFRNKIVSKLNIQKDTLKTLNILLDKKYVYFREYYKKSYYQIQESCDEVIEKKYAKDPIYDKTTLKTYDFLHKSLLLPLIILYQIYH